ncbi:acid protease [Gigaspora margarita]|uniref:Acid protease n=1 Tax=Gigaspora margarita TaxID=4874 RepID=A0A8H4B4L4_GIGMA|nr:acid protease [Gigaspora margarita]
MKLYVPIIWLFYAISIIDAVPVTSNFNSISLVKNAPQNYSWNEVQQLYNYYYMLKYESLIKETYGYDQEALNKIESTKKALSESVNLTMSDWLGYYGPVIIGGQTFNVFFDLSSSDFWLVPSVKCGSFACYGCRKFNESLSGTFENISTSFTIYYGPTEVYGFLGKDQLSLNLMGCLVWVLTLLVLKMLQLLFQTCYVGTLTLGEIDSTKLSGSFSYNELSKINDIYKHWITKVDSVSINNNKLKYEQKMAIFDIAFSAIVMPSDDAIAYHKLINGSRFIPLDPHGVYDVPCNTTDNVEFIFGKNSYSINPIFGPDGYGCCLSSVQTLDIDKDTWIFGETFLRDYYSVYNIDNFTIGFAPISVSGEIHFQNLKGETEMLPKAK